MNDGVLDVLIVDDEPDVANSTAEILASAGFAVEVTGTVPEARDVLATREVRSVLLDHTIVDWTQTDCSEERDDGPAVIVMSGLGRGELAQLEESHGDRLFACLAKPVPPARLIEIVRTAVG
jgi:DNA-binding NtrC family response regulator